MSATEYHVRAKRCNRLAKFTKRKALRRQLQNVAEIWEWIARPLSQQSRLPNQHSCMTAAVARRPNRGEREFG
jgi:hypothetical protein